MSNKRKRGDYESKSSSDTGVINQLVNLTSSNLVAGTKNTYSFAFKSTQQFGTDKEIALVSGNIFFSWPNISAALNNNKFDLRWIDGVVQTITIPDGSYQVSDISAYIQYACLQLGWYLIDNNGVNHYYINAQVNAPYYKVQFNFLALPASLPVGWSVGTSVPPWTTAAIAPQLQLTAAQTGFGRIIGFVAPGNYPTVVATVDTSVLGNSTSAPRLSPVEGVYINCNLVSNSNLSINAGMIWAQDANGFTQGQNISFNIPDMVFLPINLNSTQNLTITLNDQDGNPLQQQDTAAAFLLQIREAP